MTVTVNKTGSATIQVLEQAWQLIRQIHPEVPEVVLVLLDVKTSRTRAGHFANSRWRVVPGRESSHEVALSPRRLADPLAVLETLLHEAAHASLWPEHRGGVSKDGYYHKKEFRDRCKAFGLECSFVHARYGWARTSWPSAGPSRQYRRIAVMLARELVATTSATPTLPLPPTRQVPHAGLSRLLCQCDPPRSIYASKSVQAGGGLRCQKCRGDFSRRLQNAKRTVTPEKSR